MALTIAIITILFVVFAVYAYRAKSNFPAFTDVQLLNQHRRFLKELESSRRYIGATYFHSVEKGSAAQAELVLRGYDVDILLRERVMAEREGRDINWDACKIRSNARLSKTSLEKTEP
jgi:hypothetical protein